MVGKNNILMIFMFKKLIFFHIWVTKIRDKLFLKDSIPYRKCSRFTLETRIRRNDPIFVCFALFLSFISECKVPFFSFYSEIWCACLLEMETKQGVSNCFQNLYKDMLQKFSIINGYILYRALCVYLLQVYVTISSFASLIYNTIILG